ncbi:MAG: rhamnan synthesis F family protein [Deltaproteobacteria bacterium]|nr:rhamnan synthesis F family protein [Deltaproteobacteria bacterium]
MLKDEPLKELPELGTPLAYSKIEPIRLGEAVTEKKALLVYDGGLILPRRRVALLAHYDPDGIVDPYVGYFSKRLRKTGYSVVLCSGNDIVMDEKLRELFDAVIYRNSLGLDFTSWKAAFNLLPSLFEAEEVLLTNDSFFGPIGSLDPLYGAMNPVKCDFWGVIESPMFRPHAQSFYIVLRENALAHRAFRDFLDSISLSANRKNSVNLETTFTQWLISNGLAGAVRFPLSSYVHPKYSNHTFSTAFLKTGHFPFVKRKMIFNNPYAALLQDLPDALSGNDYPLSLITNYALRIGEKLEVKLVG